jgi:hypothetical protein
MMSYVELKGIESKYHKEKNKIKRKYDNEAHLENNKNVSTFESWLFFLIHYAVRRIFLLNIRSLHVKQIHVVVKYA